MTSSQLIISPEPVMVRFPLLRVHLAFGPQVPDKSAVTESAAMDGGDNSAAETAG